MSKPVSISFEFFPPRTKEAEENFRNVANKLKLLDPQFVSVTYGAGGTTRSNTLQALKYLKSETTLIPAGHLTCVGASISEVNQVIEDYWQAGIRHIVALRGDPLDGIDRHFIPHPQGYRNSADLIEGIRSIGDFEISISAYPEKHPESASLEEDLIFMANKAKNGATRALSQFFFHNSFFLKLRDRIAARGIDIDLVPGILPITDFDKVVKFSAKSGTSIPSHLAHHFENTREKPETRNHIAALIAAEQVEALRREGVNSFHFYTMNRADLIYDICHVLDLKRPDHLYF